MTKKKSPRRARRQRLARSQPHRRDDNLTPGGKPHHRLRTRLKVDSLPPDAHSLIARGLTGGLTYKQISADLKARGHQVGTRALSSFWRRVWGDEHETLRRARTLSEIVKAALHLDPATDSYKTAQELLIALIWHQLPTLQQRGPDFLYREVREQKKVRGKSEESAPPEEKTLSEAEIDRRIREIYGLPPADEPDDDSDN